MLTTNNAHQFFNKKFPKKSADPGIKKRVNKN